MPCTAMDFALALAKNAAALQEVPVGAVITLGGKIIATGFNRREGAQDVTLHAEMVAIVEACQYLQSWRLTDCVLYCTLEPCLMCAGAIYQARIPTVVFGASDPKAGAMGSLYSVHTDTRLNHRCAVEAGVQGQASAALLREFFRTRRVDLKASLASR